MRAITESESTPKADGFYMPAEFAPQDRVFMGWPNRPDTFAFGAVPAQRTYAGIANAISEFTPVVMCCNEADYDNCKAVFKDNERVTVMEMSINDAWFRDTGATFLVDGKGGKAATDWHFNAYGGLVDGLYFPWDKDAKIARKMADYVGVRTYRPDHVILEGGSITVDGEGTLIVTDSCLLSAGRTASVLVAAEPDAGDWPLYPRKYEPFSEELREYMTEELKQYLGVEKVIWVKEGIDPAVTNGHIDDCATFIAPGVVTCIWTDDPDYPFYRQCHEIYDTLVNATDAKGRKLKVYKLPMPEKPCFMSEEEAASIDLVNPRTAQDEPQIASYMNYLVTNKGCIVSQYGDVNDGLAVETLQKIYDETWGEGVFKCVGVDSRQVDYLSWFYNQGIPATVRATDLVSLDVIEKSRIHMEWESRLGISYTATACIAADDILFGTISLMRSKEHGDFTDEEIRIFDEVNTHLCSRFRLVYPNGVNRFMMDCDTDPIVAAYSLSPREWEVSCLLMKGVSRADIADELSISKNTLKRHIANIYHKMGVSNEMQFFAALNRVAGARGGGSNG